MVGRLVSMQPPWSIAMSITTERGFIDRTISRVTTTGLRAPGMWIAPTTTSAKATAFRMFVGCATIMTMWRPMPRWASIFWSRPRSMSST